MLVEQQILSDDFVLGFGEDFCYFVGLVVQNNGFTYS